MIRISYIIPCYNCAEFISKTLDDMIAHINLQSDEYEIICVDDCSTDDSSVVIQNYGFTHPHVRVVRHESNKRQGGARNTGLQVAMGRYIAFGDHDDRLPEFDLKALLDEMDARQLDLLMCDVNFQQEDLSLIQTPGLNKAISEPVSGTDVFEKGYMIEGGMLGVWSSFYRKDYALSLPAFAEHVRVEDADWFMRAIGKAQRVMYKSVSIYNWMFYEDSQSHGMSAEMRADIVRRGFREIEVAEEFRTVSEKAYVYCYEDGLKSIKTATNALWKKHTPFYRHRFMRQLNQQERERVVGLHVNSRCNLLFTRPWMALVIMAMTSLICTVIRKK